MTLEKKSYKSEHCERKSNLEPVNAVMDALKKALGLDESFFAVAKVWDKEVGGQEVRISGFKDGVIYAQTPHSAALHDVTIRKKDIIGKINQYLGGSKIKNIKIEIK